MSLNSNPKFISSNFLEFVLTIALSITFFVIWKGFFYKKGLPGPGYLGSLKLLNRRNALSCLEEWAKTYKDIFEIKLGPFSVTCLNSPEMIQKLLASRESGHISKPSFFITVLAPFLGDGLLVSTENKWKSRRKLLKTQMFSYGTLINYMKLFNDEADNLAHILAKEFTNENPAPKPIEDILMKSSISLISEIMLGQKLNNYDINGVDDNNIFQFTRKAKEIVLSRTLNPMLLLQPIWKMHPLYKEEQKVVKFLQDILFHLGNSDVLFKKDLLASGFTLEEILNEGITLLAAGYETTGSALHFLLFFLALHPIHQKKCQEEVDALFENLGNQQISLTDLNELCYLESCLKETIRLVPIIPIFFWKLTTPLSLDTGVTLPATMVAINVQGLHKNEEIFPNPDKFLPERFAKDLSSERHPYAYIPFSSGIRMCIGYKYATMQILVFAAKVLHRYKITTTDKFKDVVLLPVISSTPENPMKFVLEKRI